MNHIVNSEVNNMLTSCFCVVYSYCLFSINNVVRIEMDLRLPLRGNQYSLKY
jgi:hypothetical protein